jgi:BirA family transcriptional regulator, biotin operon repressor / biotin---[acetyl-CoA-carboxylase] ligase
MQDILRYHNVESTNSVALEAAGNGAKHGFSVTAEAQSAGRGRLGKTWHSPVGKGLYLSVVVRPNIESVAFPQLTFVAGLAVAEAIESHIPGIRVGLKWPNDIYFGKRKCGGILTESGNLYNRGNDRYAVIGIGLNVNTQKGDFPSEIAAQSTSLCIESGQDIHRDDLLLEIRRCLLSRIAEFEKRGFHPVIEKWRGRDVFLGHRLQWVTVREEIIEGISLGPDDDGLLHVRSDDGVIHEILSGDIRLAT